MALTPLATDTPPDATAAAADAAGTVDAAAEAEAEARELARRLRLPWASRPLETAPDATELLPAEVARRHRVVPLRADARTLTLATATPLDPALDDLGFRVGRRLRLEVASSAAIEEALSAIYHNEISRLATLLGDRDDLADVEDRATLERAARAAPLVRLVDHLIAEAARLGASDLHVEPGADALEVRLRVDGVLRPTWSLPPTLRTALVSRLKVMAGMDISVRRRPQDGGLRLRAAEREVALRISTLPAAEGEKAVLRILDPEAAPVDLEDLGLSPEDAGRLRAVVEAGRGVVLATGPTGSGKSSTLHALLHTLDRVGRNVVTLEDPVEYPLAGVTQVQVDPRSGLTFPAALRAVLRQDPDAIMVGEIRDAETARIAMAAAVTGHLVLSTLHTTDAPGALTRLVQMGVPAYLVAGGVSAVVGQRLARRCCSGCGGRGASAGCARCDGGLRGRTGIFQLLVVDDALRDAVVAGASTPALRRLARDGGMRSLAEDARRQVAEGRTTAHEILSVVRGDPEAGRPCPNCARPTPTGARGCPWCGLPTAWRCRCGRALEPGWVYCPECRERAPPR
ncbi:MAG: ATPase, T2SS/T4P/T4SS family [Longimicrobiales bacterium]|nr:ATPase, T2SS/T4P/T4SS family [Longimicrobiales bacterium]